MYHTIEFTADLSVDLDRSRKQPLERMLIRRGTRRIAQIRPHVVETPAGPVEAADLFFEDGSAARGILFDCFVFAE
jgi:hypothetical protein